MAAPLSPPVRSALAIGVGPFPSLLQAIVESAMDAIVALDDAQRIVLFNPAAEAMFGCPASAAIGQPLDHFLPERFRAAHRRHLAGFAATGDTTRAMGHLQPLTARRADGEEFPIEATIARVAIDGKPYVAAIVRDSTVRRQADAVLRRQAELLDLAYDAIFVWDWDGAITFWNRGAERLYGYARDDAVGQVSHELLRTGVAGGVDHMLASLEREQTWEGELTHVRRDGVVIDVESRLVLVSDASGRCVLEANRDVTDRKRAETERVASAEREAAARAAAAATATARDALQTILDQLPGGVLLMSAPDAGIAFANVAMRELIFGAGSSERASPVYGRDFLFARADGAPLLPHERPGVRSLRGDYVRNVQLVLQRADGSRIPIAVHAAPLHAGNAKHPFTALIFLQDITALRHAEQLKDDFLALVSHELRTPLSAIHGGARVLVNKPGLDASMRGELLNDIVIESARLERLLSNLLALTEIAAGGLTAALEPTPLSPLVRRIAAEFAERSPRHGFEIAVEAGVPPAEADPYLLEEVFRNLYENAIKYSPNGGSIRTTVTADTETIVLRVADTGIGIAREHVTTVFERFRRVGGGGVRGMGLGLYLCRGLVEAQGGRIDASSPGLGRGATFTVTLPVARGWADAE